MGRAIQDRPVNRIPTRHINALRFMSDPYRQQKAQLIGNDFVMNYVDGGLVAKENIIRNGFCGGGVLPKRPNGSVLSAGRGTLKVDYTKKYNQYPSVKYTGDGINTGSHYIRLYEGSSELPHIGFYRLRLKLYIPSTNTDSTNVKIDIRSWGDAIKTIGNYTTTDQWIDVDLIEYHYYSAGTPLCYINLNTTVATTDVFYVVGIQLTYLGDSAHGVCKGGLESTGWGQHNAALKFDGANDYAQFLDTCNLGTNDFIVWSWIKFPDTSGDKTIICKYQDGNDRWYFRMHYDSLQFVTVSNGTGAGASDTVGTLPTNTWLLAVTVFSVSGTFIKIYRDTTLLTGTSYTAPTGANLDNTGLLRLGVYSTTSYFFKDFIGLTGVYIFDGQNGAPSSLPSDYETLISELYNQTKDLYP